MKSIFKTNNKFMFQIQKITSILFLLFFTEQVLAQLPLTITPTRVIFEGRARSEVIHLYNRAATPATYRIEMVEMEMAENGKMSLIEEAKPDGKILASDLIRYSPRQVVVGPNESQTIRLLVRKPKDLPEGEYRSHLMMYSVPEESGGSLTLDSERELGEGEVAINLDLIFKISIPIVVRHGDLNADFAISAMNYQPPTTSVTATEENNNQSAPPTNDQPRLELTIERQGERSYYGDIEVNFQPDNSNQSYIIGLQKDFVVYVPNNSRTTQIPLNFPDELKSRQGSLNVSFSTFDNEQTNIRAESAITISE